MKRNLIQFFLPLLLLSCASLSKKECESGDWMGIGYRDGSTGTERTQLSKHQQACAKHGIAVEHTLYEQGYVSGLTKVYCTEKNGETVGAEGKSLPSVCPDESAERFKLGYYRGRTAYLEDALKIQRENEEKAKLKECDNDFGCVRKINCTFGVCEGTDKSCSFNSDCEVRGRCVFDKCSY